MSELSRVEEIYTPNTSSINFKYEAQAFPKEAGFGWVKARQELEEVYLSFSDVGCLMMLHRLQVWGSSKSRFSLFSRILTGS
jgi:hypothetical protein